MFYGTQVWDPVLIVAQICVIQCLFYSSLGLLLWLLVGPYVMHLTLQHFFDPEWVNFSAFIGWMVALANILNSLGAALYLMFVVERAKKCLDFAATIYILHLGMVTLLSSFPKTLAWWGINGCGLVVTAVLGEWLCVQRELQDIPLGSALGVRRPKTPVVSIEAVPLKSTSANDAHV